MLHFELGPTASTLLYSTADYGSKATLLLYFEHLSNSAPNVTEWVGARLRYLARGGTASDLLWMDAALPLDQPSANARNPTLSIL